MLSKTDCSYRRMFEGMLSEKGVTTSAGMWDAIGGIDVIDQYKI
jgi:hypothetical protein